jgi:CBS domain-containing protein
MKVSEIMTKNPIKAPKSTSIEDAAKKMEELDCGFLPIGNDERLEGVITDRDIVLRAVAKGKSPQTTLVGDILTGRVLHCLEDDDVEDAARRMQQEQVYRLVVLDNERDKRLRGIITLGDISRQAYDEELVGETAEKVAQQVNTSKAA